MTPGNSWTISLDDYFTSGIYQPDGLGVVWSQTPINTPAGANVIPDWPNRQINITTTGATHGTIEFDLFLSATGAPEGDFADTQRVMITVDHPPVFDQDLSDPLLFTFDEDTQLPLAANAKTTGVLFTDEDDTGPNLALWLEPDSPVHLSYDNINTVTFYADTNWFGSHSARFYVRDALGLTIDSLLSFTVNSVNDPPVVNFDSVSVLGDTLVIHRTIPDTIDLNLFVSDVDDPVLTWSINNPDPANLTDTLLSDNRLRLLAADEADYVDIDLVLTATDDEGASDSDTLVVSIRPWPPEIIIVEDIKINSQLTAAKHLNLADWVDDLDTPAAAMTWSFRAVDAVTGVVDPYVTYAPGSPLTGDTVNISVTQVYSAIDLLEMTVTDDAGYTDIDTARLFIFDDDGPMIYPLPNLVIYRDTSYTGIIDLDDYVVDLLDEPEGIAWTATGGESLAGFSIDQISHEVTITTNPTFIGNLTVTLVATNSRGLRDTSDLAILVSRRVDGPPLWYAVPDEVEVVYGWTTDLFTYGQICYDETPTDSIIFTPHYNSDSLTVTVVQPDSVKLTTSISDKKYTTQLYFSARDEIDSVSYSGTITVNVKDSFSPVWQRIPLIYLNVGETYSGLFLRDYVSDRDTDDNLLAIDVANLIEPAPITVSYDAVTTELTVSAGGKESDSWLIITATDDKGNTATAMIHVVVFAVVDDIPPVGGVTYFFNTAANRWIHYAAVADSTTDISRFRWDYYYDDPPWDYSDSLSFALQDSLPGTLTWIAPYHFRNEGRYELSVQITDVNNNYVDPKPSLVLSVGFSKAIGSILTSPNRRLTLSYPPAPVQDGKLLIISEASLPESTRLRMTETAGASGNNEDAGHKPATVYSLDTNLPEPILVTLTYNQELDADPYYSFYEVEGDQLSKIETFAGADGQFEAAVVLGKDIVFASSETPAQKRPLPDTELLCYPNPFNATIQVRFLLRWEDRGRIVIYNLLGREIYASSRQPFGPGVHTFSWHGIDSRGLLVPSGLYFIRLETDGGKIVMRKVTLLK